jgi:hypothetical protein
MTIDLNKHGEILNSVCEMGYILDDEFAPIKSHCLARMEMGKKTYANFDEQQRDYIDEANEELLDAINYLCMQYSRSPDVYLLRIASDIMTTLTQLQVWQRNNIKETVMTDDRMFRFLDRPLDRMSDAFKRVRRRVLDICTATYYLR